MSQNWPAILCHSAHGGLRMIPEICHYQILVEIGCHCSHFCHTGDCEGAAFGPMAQSLCGRLCTGVEGGSTKHGGTNPSGRGGVLPLWNPIPACWGRKEEVSGPWEPITVPQTPVLVHRAQASLQTSHPSHLAGRDKRLSTTDVNDVPLDLQ